MEKTAIWETQTAGDCYRSHSELWTPEGSLSRAEDGVLQHIFLRWSAKGFWNGEPQSAKGIMRISSPSPTVRGSWEQQDFRPWMGKHRWFVTSGKPGFNNAANISLLPLINMALSLDFFLFSLCRKKINYSPDNLWLEWTLPHCPKGKLQTANSLWCRNPFMPAQPHVCPCFLKQPQGIPVCLLNECSNRFLLHQRGSFEGISDISLHFTNSSASKAQQHLKTCTLHNIYLHHRQ